MICVSLAEKDFSKCLKLVEKYDFYEIRLDLVELTKNELEKLLKTNNNAIVTFRKKNEFPLSFDTDCHPELCNQICHPERLVRRKRQLSGGDGRRRRPVEKITDKTRLNYFKTAIKHKASYIDLDISNSPEFINKVKDLIHNTETKLILSYHEKDDFIGIDEIKKIISFCQKAGSDFIKYVAKSSTTEDVMDLFSLYKIIQNLIAFSLGKDFSYTRIMSLEYGAKWCYAKADESQSTADGQLSYSEMKQLINFEDKQL